MKMMDIAATMISLPAVSPAWPLVAGIGVAAVLVLTIATVFLLYHKRSRQPDTADTLHGVINKAVEREPRAKLSGTVPAIPMFDTKQKPWNPLETGNSVERPKTAGRAHKDSAMDRR